MRVSSNVLFLAALAAPALARKGHAQPNRAAHHDAAKRTPSSNAPFTYFIDGLGACGWTNGPGDFIVAVNSPDYAGGAHCGKQVQITVGGKTTTATVADECPTCSPNGLDFSQGLFQFFQPDLSVGELYGTWSFVGAAPPPPPPPPPPPSSTYTPPPPPPTTSHTPKYTPPPPPPTTSSSSTPPPPPPPPTTSSSSTPPPPPPPKTTSSSSSSSSSSTPPPPKTTSSEPPKSSLSSKSSAAPSSSSSAAPAPSTAPGVDNFVQAVLELASVVAAGHAQ